MQNQQILYIAKSYHLSYLTRWTVRTKFTEAQRWLNPPQKSDNIQMFDSSPLYRQKTMYCIITCFKHSVYMLYETLDQFSLRCFRVILCPDLLKLIQVMRAKDRPITSEVVKVVHNDGHKQIDNL